MVIAVRAQLPHLLVGDSAEELLEAVSSIHERRRSKHIREVSSVIKGYIDVEVHNVVLKVG